ncbi:hypothetical protein [Streptomyces sp. NPDC002676]
MVTSLLSELGKRLAERWVSVLVGPGLLFVGATAVAGALGHRQALDPGALRTWMTGRAGSPHARDTATVVLVVCAVLAASALAGLAATVLGSAVELLWSLEGDRRPLRWLADRRRRRWEAAGRRLGAAVSAAVGPAAPETAADHVRSMMVARDRISLVPPQYPTWTGDRLHAPDTRVRDAYHLDLGTAWPRLWLVMPDTARTELAAAHDAYTASARLWGWAVLYAALGTRWWPAELVALVAATTAWLRSRAAVAALAELTESAVDLYGKNLATELGVPHAGALTPEVGFAVSQRLHKGHISLADAEPPPIAGRTPLQ